MAAGVPAHLEVAELERLAKTVEPAAFLVSQRILRRVIRSDRQLAGIGLDVPHRKSYTIGKDALRSLVEKQELGLKPDGNYPATAILLVQPEPEVLAALPREEVLLRYWRMLFHAHVHLALEGRLLERKLTEAGLRQRIRAIGLTEFDEIRVVLRQEHFLLPPRDHRTTYIEFAAVYLELRRFAPELLPRYFPALQSYDIIDAVLAEDVDAHRLFVGTRLPGAPDPAPAPELVASEIIESLPAFPPIYEADFRRRMEEADRAVAVGNDVRALLLRTQASAASEPDLAAQAKSGAQNELAHLAERLQKALALNDTTAEQWRHALEPLRERAARGVWPVEARLLHDLQNVCVDEERPIYAVDLVEWILSLGKRPIQRLLVNQSDVLALQHLRSAVRRLGLARIAEEDRTRLSELTSLAVHECEHRLRKKLHPVIADALQHVGMCPQNVPEQIALQKLIEELLDRIVATGHLNMGHLRDAISRNNLKLPDLASVNELMVGNRLLKANRQFADALDGIYHRGEVYLRLLQRFSLVSFGTRVGRFLTRYLALPFGGAFLALQGIYHLVADLTHVHLEVLASPYTIGALGIFLFLLLHVPAFRGLLFQGLKLTVRGIRRLVELPSSLLRLPVVRLVLRHRAVRFAYHYALKPLVFAGPVWLLLNWWDLPPASANSGALAVFLAVNLLANTRLGRDLEEAIIDWLMASWRQLLIDILPGLFHLVLECFQWFVEAVDRLLYTVDEWLRFRGGDSQVSLVVKALLGVIWFAVTYVVRFVINLLIEPQINPIKHFPVVTVSHKLLLPFIPTVAGALEVTMEAGLAWTVATVVIAGIPGIFGFLVWELKENWRLFQANRSDTLQPVAIGHHGETMLRFLRPGFHSGTLPKLYTRLRRAERRAYWTKDRRAIHKYRQALHEVEESIRHFVERNLLAYLHQSKSWSGLPISVGEIALGSNRVRIELCCSLPEDSLWIAFEEQAGWLLAEVAQRGWLAHLSPEQRRALRTALAGFYKFAGVVLIRDQIRACFGPGEIAFDISEEGLIVWTGVKDEIEAVYDLHMGPTIPPRIRSGKPSTSLPTLSTAPLLYRQVPLFWQQWIDVWEQDQAGKGVPAAFLEGVQVLPGE